MTTKRQTADFQDLVDELEEATSRVEQAAVREGLDGQHMAIDHFMSKLVARLLWQLVHVEGGPAAARVAMRAARR